MYRSFINKPCKLVVFYIKRIAILYIIVNHYIMPNSIPIPMNEHLFNEMFRELMLRGVEAKIAHRYAVIIIDVVLENINQFDDYDARVKKQLLIISDVLNAVAHNGL
jgi:hypothetical protein